MKNLIAVLIILVLSSCTHKPKSYPHSVDAHMHIHPSTEVEDMEFHGSRALFAANSIGIERALVLSGAYTKMAYRDFAQTQNSFVANEVKKNKHKLAGACAVNPTASWAKEEISRCRSMGLEVLKLHTLASGMDLRNAADQKHLRAVLQKAQDLKFSLLIHGNLPRSGEARKLLSILEDYPKMRVIIGHSLGREFEHLNDFKHPNFLVELSIAPIWTKTKDEKEKLASVIKRVGIEKFIFGSDWPVIHPAETFKALNELPLKDKEKEQIIFTNGKALDDLFI